MKTMQINGDADTRLALVACARAQARVPAYVPPKLDLVKALGPDLKALLKTRGDQISAAGVMLLLEALFATADVDKSGYLDILELSGIIKAVYQLEGTSRSLSTVMGEVEKAMERYDADKSGSLAFYEFVNMFCDTSANAFFKFQIPAEVLEDARRLNLVNQ